MLGNKTHATYLASNLYDIIVVHLKEQITVGNTMRAGRDPMNEIAQILMA